MEQIQFRLKFTVYGLEIIRNIHLKHKFVWNFNYEKAIWSQEKKPKEILKKLFNRYKNGENSSETYYILRVPRIQLFIQAFLINHNVFFFLLYFVLFPIQLCVMSICVCSIIVNAIVSVPNAYAQFPPSTQVTFKPMPPLQYYPKLLPSPSSPPSLMRFYPYTPYPSYPSYYLPYYSNIGVRVFG